MLNIVSKKIAAVFVFFSVFAFSFTYIPTEAKAENIFSKTYTTYIIEPGAFVIETLNEMFSTLTGGSVNLLANTSSSTESSNIIDDYIIEPLGSLLYSLFDFSVDVEVPLEHADPIADPASNGINETEITPPQVVNYYTTETTGTGARGATGERGPQGIQGPTGPRGPAGSSANFDTSNFVNASFFDNQVDGILGSIEDGISGVNESIGQEVQTKRLGLVGATSGLVTIIPATDAGTYTLTLPTDDGGANQFLKTDGSGILSWASADIVPGVTAISGGTDTRVSFNDGGFYGEDAGFTYTKASDVLRVAGSTYVGSSSVTPPTATSKVVIYQGQLAFTDQTTPFGGSMDIVASDAIQFVRGSKTQSATSPGNISFNTYDATLVAGDALDAIRWRARNTLSAFSDVAQIGVVFQGNRTADFQVTLGNGSSLLERFRVTSTGNVGIGTTTPDKALEINSATGANMRLTYNDADGSAANYADLSTSSIGGLTITSAGTNPKTLVVNNGSSTGNIFEAQDGGTAVFTVADGIGGIKVLSSGAGNPAIFEVERNASTGTQNIVIGADAGDSLTSGDNHTFIGVGAGTSMANFGGATAVGFQALYAAGSSYDVAIGYSAGHQVLNGGANTLVGSFAGYRDLGTSNVGIGYNALSVVDNSGADGNIGIGYYAGNGAFALDTDYNILIGYNAGGHTVAYDDCLAIGRSTPCVASNSAAFGSDTAPYNSFWFNGATSTTPDSVTLNAAGGSGTDIAGAAFTIAGGKATGNAAGGSIIFQTSDAGVSSSTLQTLTTKMTILASGNVGIGQTVPTAVLHLKAGTATASTAPLKFTSGSLLTTTEAGALEFLSDDYYATITSGAGTSYTSQYPPGQSETYVKATTQSAAAAYATDPTKSLTGAYATNSWATLAADATNQRFHIDLGSTKTITRIYYENFHSSGSYQSVGVQNFTLWGSNDAGAFAELTYATDTNWTQITTASSVFLQHSGSDASDPKYITLTNSTAYRYYAFKFADSYGGGGGLGMGVRRIELQEGGTARKGLVLTNGSNLVSGRVPYASTNGRLIDNTNFVFDGTNLGIGTTTPGAPLEVKGNVTHATIAKFTDATDTTSCTLSAGGLIACSSDERLKKNIENINYGLDTVMALRPVLYNWKTESDGSTKSLGFIAQEVEALMPKLVSTDEEGVKSLNTIGMMPVLTKAIQEMNLNLEGIAGTITPEPGSATETFVTTFFDNVFAKVGEWLASATNGVTKIFVKEEICVDDQCLNKEDVRALLLLARPEGVPVPAPEPDPLVPSEPVEGEPAPEPDPEVPTCTEPQILVDNVCTDPELEIVPEPDPLVPSEPAEGETTPEEIPPPDTEQPPVTEEPVVP